MKIVPLTSTIFIACVKIASKQSETLTSSSPGQFAALAHRMQIAKVMIIWVPLKWIYIYSENDLKSRLVVTSRRARGAFPLQCQHQLVTEYVSGEQEICKVAVAILTVLREVIRHIECW